MNDAFALLGLPRRPWLDAGEVRAAFHRAAATAHPDRAGSADGFTALTRAYETLRDPAARLRHFLALAQHEPPRGEPPADLVEWFPRVAAQLHALRRPGADPGEAGALLAQLNALRDATHAGIRASADDFDELARLLARLGFLDKWIAQLGEGILALDL